MNRYFQQGIAFSLAVSVAFVCNLRVAAQQEHHDHEHDQAAGQAAVQQQHPWRQAVQQLEQVMAQQQLARQQQELTVRNQEEQARQAQQAARLREQAEHAGLQQQNRQNAGALAQQERQAQEQQHLVQEQQRQALEQQKLQQEAVQSQQRQAQEHQRLQLEQQRQQQEAVIHQQRQAQEQQRLAQEQAQQAQAQQLHQQEAAQHQLADLARQQNRAQDIANRNALLFAGQPFAPGVVRPFQPAAISIRTMSLDKAILMPVVDDSASAEEREHAAQVEQSLRTHLNALGSPPADFAAVQNNVLTRYLGNFQTNVMGQNIVFNPQNTYVANIPSYEYPTWWHPSPGWIFSNGFTIGNSINVGPDWLRFGWHPYYGPPPEGFGCSVNYVPTPAIYYPAYGLWRVAGVDGWAAAGPTLDWTGPISVEVFEHRKASITDPYTGKNVTKVINVPFLYNAFYFPEYGRWGYTNRHGYFILLNL